MPMENIFNPEIFKEPFEQALSSSFRNNIPIRHFVIDNFLVNNVANEIFAHFPAIDLMKVHYKGINEKKAEHSDFSFLHPLFNKMHHELSAKYFIEWLQKITGINELQTVEDRLGYGLTQGANNSFLDIHIDYNLHPIKKIYRKLNLIIFFNATWETHWGGNLELWDAEVRNCIQSISPVFNRCVVFECSDISFHGYSKITVPENITRKSAYQYYFIPVTENVHYHDTIFKPKPDDSFVKRWSTYSKDFIKNAGKKTLLSLGLTKFLE